MVKFSQVPPHPRRSQKVPVAPDELSDVDWAYARGGGGSLPPRSFSNPQEIFKDLRAEDLPLSPFAVRTEANSRIWQQHSLFI